MSEQAPLGILLMAYGTPDTLDDVEPYYTHIRGGRKPAPDALADLIERYRLVGGRTPLLDHSKSIVEQIQQRLDERVPGKYRVYLAMKHWHPFIADVVQQIQADGVREVVAVALAPHYSRYSLEGYRKYISKALEGVENPFSFRFIESWQANEGFRKLIADYITETMQQFPAEVRDQVAVMFSAHSLPEKITQGDNPDPYPQELHESAQGIADLLGLEKHYFCYQSAGMTGEPWLGPDILDALEDLSNQGIKHVLSVPFGFVSDHLEVQWDIDTEAQEKAAEVGIELHRIKMPNARPEFVDVIESVVLNG